MIYLILPAYNEEGDIGPLLEAADRAAQDLPQPMEIVVVDDGSTDNTVTVVKAFSGKTPVKLIAHETNMNLGAAIRTGMNAICEQAESDDIAIFMDADNTHSPAYIDAMVKKLEKDGLDVVIASRYAPGGKEIGVNPLRRMLSRCAAALYGWIFKIPGIRDYTCGYRAYRVGILQKAMNHYNRNFITETGFAAPGEILLKLRRLTSNFGEVPFELHYEQKVGESKMPKFQNILRNIVVLIKYH